jgi:hypothetical protein
LSNQPRPAQAQELEGHPNYYRLWITSAYRLLWLVNDEERWVEVQYVDLKTPDLYANLGFTRPDADGD